MEGADFLEGADFERVLVFNLRSNVICLDGVLSPPKTTAGGSFVKQKTIHVQEKTPNGNRLPIRSNFGAIGLRVCVRVYRIDTGLSQNQAPLVTNPPFRGGEVIVKTP